MMLAKLLECIEALTDYTFVEVDKGVARFMFKHDKKLIPADLLLYQKVPEDGIYYTSEYTCGKEKCQVGKPWQACVDGGHYTKRKCAVYGLRPYDNVRLSMEDVVVLVG